MKDKKDEIRDILINCDSLNEPDNIEYKFSYDLIELILEIYKAARSDGYIGELIYNSIKQRFEDK